MIRMGHFITKKPHIDANTLPIDAHSVIVRAR